MLHLIYWDIYEITSSEVMHNIMFRGRIRKFCLEHNRNVLAENTKEIENGVRFAVPHKEDANDIINYIKSLFPSAQVSKLKENVPNPVLSKLKVNKEERYTL